MSSIIIDGESVMVRGVDQEVEVVNLPPEDSPCGRGLADNQAASENIILGD